MLNFSIKLITRPQEFASLVARPDAAPALALDIETVSRWDRQVERVSLIQLAFREGAHLHVAVIDTLTRAQVLRAIADSDQVVNAEFNQAFIAVQHYGYLRRTPEAPGYQAWLNYLITLCSRRVMPGVRRLH